MKKYVGISSIPSRSATLIKTINSLVNQSDHIFVWLNGYKFEPKCSYDNVSFYISSDNIGDMGKFLIKDKFDISNEYFWFSCDDDIIYPNNYIKRYIDLYKPETVQSSHGKIYSSFPILDYSNSVIEGYHFTHQVDVHKKIHVGGTGVMMMSSNVLSSIPINSFGSIRNIADVWISGYCYQNDIDVWQLPHDMGWIKPQPIDYSDSIFKVNLKDGNKNPTELINKLFK